MKRLIIKLINLFLVLITIFPIFSINVDVNAETVIEYQKGDLRCPINSNNCEEIRDQNGNVISVNITTGSLETDEVKVVKTVKKTDTLGKYEIYFTVTGTNVQKTKIYEDTKVILVLDMSKTVMNSVEEIKVATDNFYKDLKSLASVDVAIIQFASNAIVRKGFSSDTYTLLGYKGYDTSKKIGLGTHSHVEKALTEVKKMFAGDEDILKYVVLLGDGQYWYSADTDVNKSITYFNDLHNMGVEFYMIQYAGGLPDYNEGVRNGNIGFNKPFIEQYIKPVKWWCNYGDYDYSVRNWCINNTSIDYKTIFEEVAANIEREVIESGKNVHGTLIDNIGSNFNLTNSSSRVKKITIPSITTNGVKTESFFIEVDPYATDGWHETNDSFSLTYQTTSGDEKTVSSNENPEVYWVQKKLEIKSCSGVATSDTNITESDDETKYYNISCLEGYENDNQEYISGFKADIKVNNLADGVKSFNILAGLGFPSTIELSTNVRCSYKFNTEEFTKDYQEITNKLNTTTNEKEKASLTLQKQNLDSVLDRYIDESGNNLEKYKNRFLEQDAKMQVTYNNSSDLDIANFINIGQATSNINCTNKVTQTINGKTIIASQICYESLSKVMQLEPVCLDMKTANMSDTCSNTTIDGGNQFYTDLKHKNGSIKVEILNAGYTETLHVILDDCSYTSSDLDITFRQIDLSDPFIKKYDPERQVGRNFLNTKFNFINIIKSDLWENELSYTKGYSYKMSKANVEKIRDDTDGDVNNYLGSSCYFDANNKYICDLTRNITETGVNNTTTFFEEVVIPE